MRSIASFLAAAVAGLFAAGPWAIAGAAPVGFCAAFVLVLVLSFAIPALSAAPAYIARLAAGMYTIGYAGAFLAALVARGLWYATHTAYAAFLPLIAAATIVAALGSRIGRIIRHEA